MGNTNNGDVSSFVPFNDQSHYHDCNNCPQYCSIQDWNNQAQVEHCRLAGLVDLNQSNPWVADQLNSWVKNVVTTYGFDGLRVDTTPEVGCGIESVGLAVCGTRLMCVWCVWSLVGPIQLCCRARAVDTEL